MGTNGRSYTVDSAFLVGDAYERWARKTSLNLSPRTVELYQQGLAMVFARMGLTLDDFHGRYVVAMEAGDEFAMEDLIDGVKAVLLELYGEYSGSHVLQGYKGFLSFMRANKLRFDDDDMNDFRKRKLPERSNHIAKIGKMDIRDMLDASVKFGRTEVTKDRNVALIHVLKDSGLGRSDLVLMDVGDVLPCIEAGVDWCQMQGWRVKTGNKQIPHLGPEAMHALEEYLEARRSEKVRRIRNGTRERKVMIPGETLAPSDPLFIFIQTTQNHVYGDRMTADSITSTIKKIAARTGRTYSPHSFRSYNWTRLEAGRMPKNWCQLAQGRNITDSSEAYTLRWDVPDDMRRLLEAYQMAYDEIAVTDENRLSIMEEEKKALEAKVAESADEMLAMRRKLDEMTPAFAMIQRMMEQEKELDELRKAAAES